MSMYYLNTEHQVASGALVATAHGIKNSHRTEGNYRNVNSWWLY
jgi:hypothetical protein